MLKKVAPPVILSLLACGGGLQTILPSARLPAAPFGSDQPPSGRVFHHALLLEDGRVLMVGGKYASTDSYLFDPSTDAWSVVPYTEERASPAVALLSDGGALIAGGVDYRTMPGEEVGSTTAEVFDPETLSFTATAPMRVEALMPRGALLPDGRVLLVNCYPLQATWAKIYDPTTEAWADTARPLKCGWMDDLISTSTGALLGSSDGREAVLRSFDAATETWTDNRDSPRRGIRRLIGLPDGRVLATSMIFGELEQHDAVLYDPQTRTWTPTGPMPRVAQQGQLVEDYSLALVHGRVMLSGGVSRSPTNKAVSEVLVLDPATNEWSSAEGLEHARYGHSVTELPDGRVLVYGGAAIGEDGEMMVQEVEFYHPDW